MYLPATYKNSLYIRYCLAKLIIICKSHNQKQKEIYDYILTKALKQKKTKKKQPKAYRQYIYNTIIIIIMHVFLVRLHMTSNYYKPLVPKTMVQYVIRQKPPREGGGGWLLTFDPKPKAVSEMLGGSEGWKESGRKYNVSS